MVLQCGFSGNSDLYGLGIRVGIFLQWLSSQIAVYFHLEGSNDLSNAYVIFSVAIKIALFVLTFQESAYTLEVVVIIYMFFGGLLCVKGYRKRREQAAPTTWRMLLGNSTLITMSIYSSWFWITGRSSDRFVSTPCGTMVFLFARIPARHFGRVSIFFTVLSIYLSASGLSFAAMICKSTIIYIRGKKTAQAPVEDLPSDIVASIIKGLNDVAQPYLVVLLRYYCAISSSAASSARLEDIKPTHLVVSANKGATAHIISLKPPLSSYNEIKRRLEELYDRANKELRAESIGGESDVLYVTGRMRASYRHLRRVFKPRAGQSSHR